jgi:hypothetical protein
MGDLPPRDRAAGLSGIDGAKPILSASLTIGLFLSTVMQRSRSEAPNRVFTGGTHSAEYKPTPLIQLV